jgi:hypothetical protein
MRNAILHSHYTQARIPSRDPNYGNCAMLKILACGVLALSLQSVANGAKLLRFPDVSETHVSFVYGGDIYLSARAGGLATRLTSHVFCGIQRYTPSLCDAD